MPATQSLDELIAHKAADFAEQVRTAAAMAANEADVRHAVVEQLAFIKQAAGVELKAQNEFTVASGRIDSVYSRVVIEYKNPKSPGDKIGPRADSPGSVKVVKQIKKRFQDLEKELGHAQKDLFGVGLDGVHFIFVRYRDDKWQVQDPVEVNKVSAARFLWALFNLGHKGKPFQPEYLAGDFGAETTSLALDGVKTLYDAIRTTDSPKAQTFFKQWKILFGEVCGYDVDNPSDKMKKLATTYNIPAKGFQPAELLFALHTYYAIFMKLLAAEIVAFFHQLPTPLEKLIQAPTGAKLKREMEELEKGGIFQHLGITNFLEGDLFAWYPSAWSEPIKALIRAMVTKLDDYNPGTLSENPAESRDLLKKLYQQLFPKSVRHDLGEYYTPDWLAEHVLNEVGYAGDPDKRLLDPACGSGTFLVMAINRIKKWFDEHREECGYDQGGLGRKILANVIGFDLNPLAVMAARTNYLIAIRELVGHLDRVEIPIYLCDSIMTPSEYGGLFAGDTKASKELKTAADVTFLIPTEIATDKDVVARYAEQLELGVRNGYSPKEFIERCKEEGLPVEAERLHTGLYEELVKLDRANKNGVWARIIKNAFAPLFVGRVNFVAGNPPWVNWSNLPTTYRTETGPLWQKYNLFPHKGLRARTGSAMDDISVLMTYVSADAYLIERGHLGFVITQSVFKTEGGGEGFRGFALPNGEGLKVLNVCDMSSFQPFDGATNRTATFAIERGERNRFPVSYQVWRTLQPVTSDNTLEEVLAKVSVKPSEARPVSPDKLTSPWIVGTPQELNGAAKCFGPSAYQGRYGTHCHASGIYWVEEVKQLNAKKSLIRNLGEVGKTKYPSREHRIDREYLFPLARGRDIERWSVSSRCWMVLAQDDEDKSKAKSELSLKRESPDTFSFFKSFETELRKRSGYQKFFRPGVDPFYSVYNVGPYTFSPFKVLWREVAQELCAGVSDGSKEVLVPDHTLVSVAAETLDEDHYLCAMLNSSPSNFIVSRYVALHPAPHILKYIAIPKYSKKQAEHRELAESSRRCHKSAAKGRHEEVQIVECEIDLAAAKIWGLSQAELRALSQA